MERERPAGKAKERPRTRDQEAPESEDRAEELEAIVAPRLRALKRSGIAALAAVPFAFGLSVELFITLVSGRPTGGLAFLVGLAFGLLLDGGVALTWLAARQRFHAWEENARSELDRLGEAAALDPDPRAELLGELRASRPAVLSRKDLTWTRSPYPAGGLGLAFSVIFAGLWLDGGPQGFLIASLLTLGLGLSVIALQVLRRPGL